VTLAPQWRPAPLPTVDGAMGGETIRILAFVRSGFAPLVHKS
jgi:hypothetical protein